MLTWVRQIVDADKIFFAAASSAGLVLAVNLMLRKVGTKRILYIGPVLEEGVKTGSAIFFQASVPGTHMVFGLFEAVADLVWGGRRRVLAGLAGFAAHTVFGLVTYFLMNFGAPVLVAVLVSTLIHIAWNTWVLKMSK